MNTKNAGLLVIAVIAIVAVGIFAFSSQGKKEMSKSPSLEPKKEMREVSYKDGMYKKEGTYTSPAGPEKIDVTLTIKDGKVTEAEVTPYAEHAISVKMQTAFVENFKPMVLGKNIKDLNLGKIAGSSLTPKGFNEAVEKIKAEAKS